MTRSGTVLTLPPVAHIPGRTQRHPTDLFDDLKSGLSAELSAEALAASSVFQGALEALERRYYWEAHELFEAVWACLPPASAERNLLRGLIQIANAGLKARMGRTEAVVRIRALAAHSLAEAFLHGHVSLMGLTPAGVEERMRRIGLETVETE